MSGATSMVWTARCPDHGVICRSNRPAYASRRCFHMLPGYRMCIGEWRPTQNEHFERLAACVLESAKCIINTVGRKLHAIENLSFFFSAFSFFWFSTPSFKTRNRSFSPFAFSVVPLYCSAFTLSASDEHLRGSRLDLRFQL